MLSDEPAHPAYPRLREKLELLGAQGSLDLVRSDSKASPPSEAVLLAVFQTIQEFAEAEPVEAAHLAQLLLHMHRRGWVLPYSVVAWAVDETERGADTGQFGMDSLWHWASEIASSVEHLTSGDALRVWHALETQARANRAREGGGFEPANVPMSVKASRFIKDGGATPEVLDPVAAGHGREFAVQVALLRKPELFARPAIRAAFRGGTNTRILEHLCLASKGVCLGEFPGLLRCLLELTPEDGHAVEHLVRVIEEATPEQLGTLGDADVAALLASDHAGLRLAAVRALPQVGGTRRRVPG
jgi:hypothetical protein